MKKAAEGVTAIQDRKYEKELRDKDKEHQSRMKALQKEHRKEKNELLDKVDTAEHNAREAERAMAECRRRGREKDEEIDKLKVKHRDSMQRQKKKYVA